jgi:TPR repeat protein
MKNLTATICLAVALLLGSAGVSWSQDRQKGSTAYQSGDYATALREWKPLAEQGDAVAQYFLGTMYDNGQGVLQDNVYAHMWMNIAASSGDKDAVKYRGIVAKRMTPADISTAPKLARECVRKNYKGC